MLARDFFIDALSDSEMLWRIHQTRTKYLREVLTTALGVEAFYVADRHRTRVQARAVLPSSIDPPISEPENDLQKQVGELRQVVNQLLTKRDQPPWRHPRSARLPANYSCPVVSHVVALITCSAIARKETYGAGKRLPTGFVSRSPAASPSTRLPPLELTVKNITDTADGPLVTGSVFAVEVTFLVDTGANVTILKPYVVNKIPVLERPSLERVDTSMLLADGNSLPFQGRGRYSI